MSHDNFDIDSAINKMNDDSVTMYSLDGITWSEERMEGCKYIKYGDAVTEVHTSESGPAIKRKSDRRIYMIWITTVLVLLAGAGWAVYNDSSTVINKRVVDIRECKVNLDDVEVKGRRYYTKYYTEVLGIRFMQKKDIEETTEIHHDYTETVVVGMTKGEWWRSHLTKGEPTRRVLAPTDHYVFVQEGNAVVINYEAFCK